MNVSVMVVVLTNPTSPRCFSLLILIGQKMLMSFSLTVVLVVEQITGR